MKIYLVAGEPSGDALGARLMRALRRKTCNSAVFLGLGGEAMEREGLHPLFDISDLAVMGLAEVIPSIPKVLGRINQTVKHIIETKPDIVVTIDSWSFSSRIHKKLRRLNLGIPQVHYVAPQVWAWKKKRAKTMHKYIDHLLTLLPQEPKYFTPYGLDTTFVGHPVIESSVVKGSGEEFRKKFDIQPEKRLIAVLPGSRKNEVSRLLPVFLDTAKMLYEMDNSFHFVIPTVRTVSGMVKELTTSSNLPVTIVEDVLDRHNAFNAVEVAMAASGTVALELAIANVPHLIAYKVSPLTAFFARRFVKIQFVNLSNILLGREIIPELIQERCVPGNIKSYILELLKKGDLFEKQMDGFKKVQELLGMGKQSPSDRAAEVIISLALREECYKEVKCVYAPPVEPECADGVECVHMLKE